MGEISNSYLISFWQSALNIDLDVIPSDEFPKVKLSDSVFLKGEPSDEIYQNSGYPSKRLFPLFIAKIFELVGTLLVYLIIYGLMDILYIHVTFKKIQSYALAFKNALYKMIFLSFVIRYAFENFLAITITIALEILDLYCDKHSTFKNKRTDLFFSLSILITFLTILGWVLALVLLYI